MEQPTAANPATPPEWTPDDSSESCTKCKNPFSLTSRRVNKELKMLHLSLFELDGQLDCEILCCQNFLRLCLLFFLIIFFN